MFKRIAQALWGKFESKEEVQKFAMLALMFGLIIGTYWAMRPIKDSIFLTVVGRNYLWMAKIVSLFVITPLILVYSKLVDTFPREKVFYGLIVVYTALALFFWWAFSQPVMGLTNTVEDPTRYIGWAWYVFVESFGSLIVALFWAITTDITLPDSAKRGFPLIALFGQIGNILGPLVLNARRLGFANSAPILGILAGLMALTLILMWLFFNITPKDQLASFKSEKKHAPDAEPGFFEGLKLLLTESYLLGIFLIISLYEVIVTVIDYHFKQTVSNAFGSEREISAFLSDYAFMVGVVATLSVLLGINNIQRKLGMTASLVLLPILVAVAVLLITWYPSALYLSAAIMVFSKAINYALNQPTLKQLYIPTSSDTKYKAQAWIEMFGSRGSKATASMVNGTRGVLGLTMFLTMVSIGSMGLIAGWILVAIYVAKTYNSAIDKNEIVC